MLFLPPLTHPQGEPSWHESPESAALSQSPDPKALAGWVPPSTRIQIADYGGALSSGPTKSPPVPAKPLWMLFPNLQTLRRPTQRAMITTASTLEALLNQLRARHYVPSRPPPGTPPLRPLRLDQPTPRAPRRTLATSRQERHKTEPNSHCQRPTTFNINK